MPVYELKTSPGCTYPSSGDTRMSLILPPSSSFFVCRGCTHLHRRRQTGSSTPTAVIYRLLCPGFLRAAVRLGNNRVPGGAQQPGRTYGHHQARSTGGWEEGSRWSRGFHTTGNALQPTIPFVRTHTRLPPRQTNKHRSVATWRLNATPKEDGEMRFNINTALCTWKLRRGGL
ncbi:hypothetical protein DPEC_G00345440 [Dallia pectoralis]|uniref:Uncharacterized protein n=1 Tax=Dallia pectoralis TaxID=75939 RepID=A0ACC2F3H7_DALPE|nr:hypothetical protein DPEC_G00345440 [Dallia pectoralis]